MQMSKEIKKYLKEIKLLLPASVKKKRSFSVIYWNGLRIILMRIQMQQCRILKISLERLWKLRKAICPLWIWMYCLSVCPSAILSVDFFAIAAICMILGLCVYSICMYKAYICYKDTLVTNSETVIVD